MLFGKLALRNDFFKNLIMITPFENWTLCLQNRDFPDKKKQRFSRYRLHNISNSVYLKHCIMNACAFDSLASVHVCK